MTISLALFEDKLLPGQTLSWPAAPRMIYVRWGALRLAAASGTRMMPIESATLVQEAIELSGDGDAWSFELSARSTGAMSATDQARCILAGDIDLDPTKPVLFRADRVQFAPRGVTPRHGHRGAGIRRLIYGRLAAQIGHEVKRINAGDAWFESGTDPVVGRNLAPSSAFVRAMALSPELKGKPSFVPWTPEDAAMPRGVAPRQYFDEIVNLPMPG